MSERDQAAGGHTTRAVRDKQVGPERKANWPPESAWVRRFYGVGRRGSRYARIPRRQVGAQRTGDRRSNHNPPPHPPEGGRKPRGPPKGSQRHRPRMSPKPQLCHRNTVFVGTALIAFSVDNWPIMSSVGHVRRTTSRCWTRARRIYLCPNVYLLQLILGISLQQTISPHHPSRNLT